MIEIKTITANTAQSFDKEINAALTEGWELVRRECFITGSDRAMTLYAELERFTAEPVDYDAETEASWELTRSPRNPYRCSECGYTANEQWSTCPGCGRTMRRNEV